MKQLNALLVEQGIDHEIMPLNNQTGLPLKGQTCLALLQDKRSPGASSCFDGI